MRLALAITRDALLIHSLISALLATVISMASVDVLPEWSPDDHNSIDAQAVFQPWDLDDGDKPFFLPSGTIGFPLKYGVCDSSNAVQANHPAGFYFANGIRAPPR